MAFDIFGLFRLLQPGKQYDCYYMIKLVSPVEALRITLDAPLIFIIVLVFIKKLSKLK